MTDTDLKEQFKCKLCPEAIKRVLATMLDFRLMKYKPFLVYMMHTMCLSMGVQIPTLFIKDRCMVNGNIPEEDLLWIVSAFGICNCLGRALTGLTISLTKKITPLQLLIIMVFGAGLVIMLSSLSYAVWFQYGIIGFYGFMICKYFHRIDF